MKKANPKKINIFHVSFKIHKTLVNAILDAYMLIKVLNMLMGKIHQQQNSRYLRGEKEKREQNWRNTQGFFFKCRVIVLFLTDIWQVLILVESRDGDKHMKNVQHH